MLAGLEPPTTGRIFIHGRDATGVSAHERPTSMVFQDYALFPHLNVRDNVAFGLKVRGVRKDERYHRAEQMLEALGLGGLGARMPRELSGGQRQRVAMSRSLILEPKVLLLDEPLGALDAQVRRQLQTELRVLQRRLQLTFVYVTHDQEEAMVLSDRIVVMNRGRIIQQGRPEDVYRHPRTAFVARFLGDCNLLRGRQISSDQGGVAVQLNGLGLVHVDRQWVEETPIADVTVGLRPEDVALSALGRGRVDATVRDRTFLGSTARYVLDLEGVELKAVIDQGSVFEPGRRVGVGWDDRDLSLILDDADSSAEASS
jgi:ABC-type Fe3+/spermidine/putrescine transport system ATPase subunit